MSELNLIRRLKHHGDCVRIITNAVDGVYDSIEVYQDETGLLDDDGYLFSEYEENWKKNNEAVGKILDHYCVLLISITLSMPNMAIWLDLFNA